MSKLKELIQALCPNGVEYKKLEEIGTFFGGLTGKSKEDFKDGNAKFITYRNIYANPALNIEIEDTVKIYDNEKQHIVKYGDILFTGSSETPEECGMSSVVASPIDEPLYLNSFCFGLRLHNLESYNIHFLKHLLRSSYIRSLIKQCASGVTRYNVSKKRLGKIEIPVPPIEVQEEIVRILDAFTEMTASLQARKEQYEYYRNLLLSFNTTYGGADDEQKDRLSITPPSSYKINWLPMSEICDIRNGYTPSKANPDFWEGGTIPWFRMEDIRQNGRILSDSIQHITPQAVKGGKYFPANSIILATTATIGEHALIIADSQANQRFTNLSIRKSLINKIDIKYFFYYMFIVDEWCKNNTNISGFASVDMAKFKKLLVPVPPLEVQEKIVSVLDKFETMVSDLSAGLPAEIAARQEQYEYYRNRLLTFPRL